MLAACTDIAFFDRVPVVVAMSERRLVLMEKESNPSYFDGFWMVPRPLLEDFSDAIDRFYREKWRRERKLPWPPEWGFFPWLRRRAAKGAQQNANSVGWHARGVVRVRRDGSKGWLQ